MLNTIQARRVGEGLKCPAPKDQQFYMGILSMKTLSDLFWAQKQKI
jgi:hypothetical protein